MAKQGNRRYSKDEENNTAVVQQPRFRRQRDNNPDNLRQGNMGHALRRAGMSDPYDPSRYLWELDTSSPPEVLQSQGDPDHVRVDVRSMCLLGRSLSALGRHQIDQKTVGVTYPGVGRFANVMAFITYFTFPQAAAQDRELLRNPAQDWNRYKQVLGRLRAQPHSPVQELGALTADLLWRTITRNDALVRLIQENDLPLVAYFLGAPDPDTGVCPRYVHRDVPEWYMPVVRAICDAIKNGEQFDPTLYLNETQLKNAVVKEFGIMGIVQPPYALAKLRAEKRLAEAQAEAQRLNAERAAAQAFALTAGIVSTNLLGEPVALSAPQDISGVMVGTPVVFTNDTLLGGNLQAALEAVKNFEIPAPAAEAPAEAPSEVPVQAAVEVPKADYFVAPLTGDGEPAATVESLSGDTLQGSEPA